MSDVRLVNLTSVVDLINAEMIQGLLEANDIPCEIRDKGQAEEGGWRRREKRPLKIDEAKRTNALADARRPPRVRHCHEHTQAPTPARLCPSSTTRGCTLFPLSHRTTTRPKHEETIQ